MATYPPPNFTEPLSVFNPANWETFDETLTTAEGDKRYLRFPVAQGAETLQDIIVNGTATFNNPATFNNNISVGSAGTANLTPQITTYKSQLNLGSGGNGELNIECPVDIGGFGSLNMTTANINLGSNSNILQTSGTQNTLNKTDITTANGVSATPALNVVDSVSGNTLHFVPNSGAGSYNPASDAGNQVLVASGTKNTEVLELTTWSDTNASVKIANNSVSMGAGGALNTPTTSVVCDGTNVIVNPNIKYPDNTIQNSAFSGAGNLAGSYTNTNMTIDANGKITALANGSSTIPSNLTLNSLTINNGSGTSQPSWGITNNWNTGASLSFTGSGGRNVGYLNNAFCANTSFRIDSWTQTIPPAIASLFEINFTFWNGSNWGQTYCYLQLYPNRLFNTSAIYPFAYWNINNKIDGNGSYNYTNATYAPSGRMYWTYQQNFSGVSGANGWVQPKTNYVDITFQIPDNSYSYECNVRCLDATSMTTQNRSWQIYSFST